MPFCELIFYRYNGNVKSLVTFIRTTFIIIIINHFRRKVNSIEKFIPRITSAVTGNTSLPLVQESLCFCVVTAETCPLYILAVFSLKVNSGKFSMYNVDIQKMKAVTICLYINESGICARTKI